MNETDPFLSYTLELQEFVGRENFEQNLLQALAHTQVVPHAKAHLFLFYPAGQRSRIFDTEGEVRQGGQPLNEIIDDHAHELPRFQEVVEGANTPAALRMLQTDEEVETSTIFRAVLSPFGLRDVLQIPLLQEESRQSVILGNPETYRAEDLAAAERFRTITAATLRNHYWLTHAEANGRHIAEVRGTSAILPIEEDGQLPSWPQAVATFAERDPIVTPLPPQPPAEILAWVDGNRRHYPLESPDHNRQVFYLDNQQGLPLHTVFLGDRTGQHRLLLYRPVGVPPQFRLTPREVEVLEGLTFGRTNAEIARTLGISPFTARNYVEQILHKLGASNRQEAATLAVGWFREA